MAVYRLESSAPEGENPSPGHNRVSLFRLWSGRSVSRGIQRLIVASFNPNNVLQRVVRGLIDKTTLAEWETVVLVTETVCRACIWFSDCTCFPVHAQMWTEHLCGCTCASIVFWVICQSYCLMLLCIDNFSFILCACSCIICWKWGQHASNPLLHSYGCKKKREREEDAILKKPQHAILLSMSVILGLFLIFLDKWALKAFSQMSPLFRPLNDNPGLWTRLQQLSMESMWSILSLNEADVQWDGKCPDIHQVREIRHSLGKNPIGEPGRAGSCSSWMVAGPTSCMVSTVNITPKEVDVELMEYTRPQKCPEVVYTSFRKKNKKQNVP